MSSDNTLTNPLSKPLSTYLHKTFRHYKNKHVYVVLFDNVPHSETMEMETVYVSAWDFKVWVRPTEMFYSDVNFNGVIMKRFRPITSSDMTEVETVSVEKIMTSMY